jgi:hypothetical protein
MKKENFKKIIMGTLSCGLLFSLSSCENSSFKSSNTVSDKTLTESEFLAQLNPESKAAYNSLNSDGKKLALQLANQACKGKNSCKGMNSCKTDKNSCAGLGGCKGTSAKPFTDKNQAVKVAVMRMADKRNGL